MAMQHTRDPTAKLPSAPPFAGASPPPYHHHHYGTFSPPPPPPVAAAAYDPSLKGQRSFSHTTLQLRPFSVETETTPCLCARLCLGAQDAALRALLLSRALSSSRSWWRASQSGSRGCHSAASGSAGLCKCPSFWSFGGVRLQCDRCAKVRKLLNLVAV
uniref:Predicted protein n=1 Tax=Hordeum vulgare subsp. vulgare TaxID=112509 RepID=F2D8V7_HORVV|nr:predicted protein [Hordeum vulgare subsp. vulgare]